MEPQYGRSLGPLAKTTYARMNGKHVPIALSHLDFEIVIRLGGGALSSTAAVIDGWETPNSVGGDQVRGGTDSSNTGLYGDHRLAVN